MAKSNALTWIINEAKKLRREYPKRFKTWTEYVKQASAIYHSKGARLKKPVTHKRKKNSGMPKRKKAAPKKRAAIIRKIKTYHKKEGRAIRAFGTVRALGTVSHYKGKAKSVLEHEIGRLTVQQFKAKKKTIKRKIGKRIALKKQEYRKLS